MGLLTIGAIVFLVHGLVGSIDGVYFHLRKYRLYAHPDSFMEHVTHTLRAYTLTAAAILLFALNAGGWLLWMAVLVLVVDLVIETWDVLIERDSRARFGGLSSAEYLVHAHAIFLYGAAWTLGFVAKPASAWSLSSPMLLPEGHPQLVSAIGWAVAVGAFWGAIQHTWFCLPRHRAAQT